MNKEFIVYEGEFFTIEWYYSKSGNSQAFEYFENLDKNQKKKILYLVKRIGDFGKISDKT